MQNSTTNLLLINLCFSNLLISFLVKPISAIYVGYSMSTGSWQVSLVFCSMFTMIYRTTWCVLPFTIVAFSWLYILPVIWLPEKFKILKYKYRSPVDPLLVNQVNLAQPPSWRYRLTPFRHPLPALLLPCLDVALLLKTQTPTSQEHLVQYQPHCPQIQRGGWPS